MSPCRFGDFLRPPLTLGGDEEDRTPDPLRAKQVLSQLSYTPVFQGSGYQCHFPIFLRPGASKLNNIKLPLHPLTRTSGAFSSLRVLLRKEVIQPHLPIRLPCYDFTPIINPTFGSGFLR